MTNPAPDRTIGGPPPRTVRPEPDLSRMIAERRAETLAQAPTPATATEPTQAPTQPRQKADSTPKRAQAAKRAQATRPPVSSQSSGGATKSTTYLSDATRERARAAYRATNDAEGDTSWSDFVEKAIAAESQRREILYNAGQPYAGDGSRLRAGRPLG